MAKSEHSDDEPVEKPEGNKKKLIIIGTALLVSLACITSGVVFYLNSTAGDTAHSSEPVKGAVSSKKIGPPAIYGLEPFVVNIKDNNDIRYLNIKLEL